VLVLLSITCAAACSGGTDVADVPADSAADSGDVEATPLTTAELTVPADFSFRATNAVAVDVTVLSAGAPRPNVVVSVFDAVTASPGKWVLLGRGLTDAGGKWKGTVTLPTRQSAVNVVANALGTRSPVRVPVKDGTVTVRFGGEE
jgi:hypothetical protein